MNTLYHTPLREVTLEDIPEEYRDIAETVGLEALERQARNRAIRSQFNGGNYRSLAAQYRLSERQIRKIIHHTY